MNGGISMTMRKIALCISILLLTALLFPGCGKHSSAPAPTDTPLTSPSAPAPTDPIPTVPSEPAPTDPTPTVPNKPEIPSGNSSPEDELRKIADQVIKEQYGISDLGCFKIDIRRYQKGARVTYELFIHGYPTNSEFAVTFDTNGNFSSVYDYNCSKYLKYLPNATPEAVQAAVKQLEADPMVAHRPNAPLYYSIDQEGYLCLGTEVIINIDPPEDETFTSGCNIDHKHIFPSARVCHYQ
jgi:hypothetical protein